MLCDTAPRALAATPHWIRITCLTESGCVRGAVLVRYVLHLGPLPLLFRVPPSSGTTALFLPAHTLARRHSQRGPAFFDPDDIPLEYGSITDRFLRKNPSIFRPPREIIRPYENQGWLVQCLQPTFSLHGLIPEFSNCLCCSYKGATKATVWEPDVDPGHAVLQMRTVRVLCARRLDADLPLTLGCARQGAHRNATHAMHTLPIGVSRGLPGATCDCSHC